MDTPKKTTADFTALIDKTLAEDGAIVINTRGSHRNNVVAACAVANHHLGDKSTIIPWSENGDQICIVIAMDPHAAWDKFTEVVNLYVARAISVDPPMVDIDELCADMEELRQRINADQMVFLSTFIPTTEPEVRKITH